MKVWKTAKFLKKAQPLPRFGLLSLSLLAE